MIASARSKVNQHNMGVVIFFIALIAVALVKPAHAQRPELVLDTGPGFVHSMAFSPGGRILASSADNHSTMLWDVASGRLLQTLGADTTSVESVAFSPDGSILAEGSNDKTIKLWDVNQARKLRTLAGHSEGVLSVTFSPDGRIVASCSYDKTVKLWDVATGRLLRTLAGHSKAVASIAFSPDGRILASGGADSTVRLWDVASGRVLRTLTGHLGLGVAFSPRGHTLAVTNDDDKCIRLWDVSGMPGAPRLLGVLDQHEKKELYECDDVFSRTLIAFSPDGRTLVAGGCHLRLWDVTNARELRELEDPAEASAVAFGSDGSLAAADRLKTIKIWPFSGAGKPRVLADHRARICSLAVDPQGRALAARSLDGTIKLWDVSGGREHLITTKVYGDEISCFATLAFDPDGRILAGANGRSTTLWDVSTGKELRSLKDSADVESVAFGPDGRTVESSGSDGTIRFWEVTTGKELRTLHNSSSTAGVNFSPDGNSIFSSLDLWDITGNEMVRRMDFPWVSLNETSAIKEQAFAFSPDGHILASCNGLWDLATHQLRALPGCVDGRIAVFSPNGKIVAMVNEPEGVKITLWDVATGHERLIFSAHESIQTLAFSPDGHILVTASVEGRITLWGVSSGRELATLFLLDKGDWAVLDPAGRFDASPRGMELMHWAVGLHTIELAQLKERYYEPGLLRKILGLNKEPLHDVAAFNDVKLYPEVSAEAPPPGSTALKLKLADLGGGIGRVQVFVNGIEFQADARGPKPLLSSQTSLTVDLAGAHVKRGEPNEIRVVAWNADGYLSSRGFTVNWEPAGERDLAPPELHAIVAGVSEYSSPEIQLRFAAKDAEEAALALGLGGRRLFGADHVHITVLTSPAASGGEGATKANLKKAFETAAKAKPGDVFVVYLAGHGLAIQGLYAYPTAEARTLNLSDLAVRLQSAVTDEELVNWINRIPALHKVMILDTCAAGAIEGRLIEQRGISGDQIRAMERLKDRTGFYVLMGAAADASSYEASQFGQGLLTYALLKGMKGAALREGQFVDVATLFQEVADDVPELAKDIGGIQQPRIAMPGGASFDIGQLLPEDRVAIPLATAKPLLLRPLFLNTQLHRDNLRLSDALQKRLRNQSYAAGRGESGQHSAIYVDQDDFPGAVSPSGDYTVEENRVRVTIVLARDGREISHFTTEGNTDDVDALSASIAAEIDRALRK